ncbi:hypothetical protein ZIOFF_024589 [Zingiber officinale]|uniref:Uncharacterized protein n=1 Tax=Zingiber officinale TaxID=94328 RepID=A0A8J5GWK3_ZINOF|nr:hypothetical protein ZIOFF_024589 [Zingiber officinale]
MVRRLDPRVSYLDVEKSFYKNKGKMSDYAVSIPSNVIVEEPRPPKKLDTYQKNPQSVKDSNVNVSRPTMSRRLKAMKSSEGSIQDIMSDPLMEALEFIIGDGTSLGGKLEATQADVGWAEVELLIEVLQTIEGASSLSKGHFFKSRGLTSVVCIEVAATFYHDFIRE